MEYFVGIPNSSPLGADFFLLDRRVRDALNMYGETNVSILSLISKLGFRQKQSFIKKELYGRSGWTLEKKFKLLLDSVIAFTFKPILHEFPRFFNSFSGFAYATYVLFNALSGNPTEGWSSIMITTLIIGGTQMIMLGVLASICGDIDEARTVHAFIESDFGLKIIIQ